MNKYCSQHDASPGEPHVLWVGLGSNMGDRLGNLQQAVSALDEHPGVRVCRGSRVYETDFVGPGKQDPYLNACLEISTDLAPMALLAVLKEIEAHMGRQSDGHLKPRPIDLDILLWRNLLCSEPRLIIPHPRARERAFVLEPLAELAATEIFLDSGETTGAACAKIRRKSGPSVRLFPLPNGGIATLLAGPVHELEQPGEG